MEIIDIINEHGYILDQSSKEIAHQRGLLHKTVIGQIFDSKGRILLVRPYSHRQDAGQFVSPVGGHVSAGESNKDAMIREMKEEVNISTFENMYCIGMKIFDRFVLNRHENHMFVVYEIITDEEPKLGDEAETYKWFTEEELKQQLKENPKDFGESYWFVVKNFYPKLREK
jgi:ADP-ribose pyrophosphatase YjhB (NUDIX family)